VIPTEKLQDDEWVTDVLLNLATNPSKRQALAKEARKEAESYDSIAIQEAFLKDLTYMVDHD
jgi:hypothetical protein